jgi:hypothetical protein
MWKGAAMNDDLQIILDKIQSLLENEMPWDMKGYIYAARSDIERAMDCAEKYKTEGLIT